MTVNTRSVAVAPDCSLPVSSTPTTTGVGSDSGWPSMTASASMPPTPKPSTPTPLIIVVCESVPTSVSGNAASLAVVLACDDDGGEVLQVDLVHDAGPGRHDAEVAERLLRPAEHRVALGVALVLQLDVLAEGLGGAEAIHLDRVVDHEIHGDERVDLGRVAAQGDHRVTHDGEVDDTRHAGEVLQHDARRHVRHLGGRARARLPCRERTDVVLADELTAAVAQHVLEQHLDGVRHPGQVGAKGVEPPDGVGRSPGVEGGACSERVCVRAQTVLRSTAMCVGSAAGERRLAGRTPWRRPQPSSLPHDPGPVREQHLVNCLRRSARPRFYRALRVEPIGRALAAIVALRPRVLGGTATRP